MSMKENVDYIKQELSTEEKFFEGTVKLERFWKKFKFLIIAFAVIVVSTIVGLSYKSSMDEQNKIAANEALNLFLKDYKNEAALNDLKVLDAKLYEIAIYLKASKENNIQNMVNSFNNISESADEVSNHAEQAQDKTEQAKTNVCLSNNIIYDLVQNRQQTANGGAFLFLMASG